MLMLVICGTTDDTSPVPPNDYRKLFERPQYWTVTFSERDLTFVSESFQHRRMQRDGTSAQDAFACVPPPNKKAALSGGLLAEH
jgi:hypothetical protein